MRHSLKAIAFIYRTGILWLLSALLTTIAQAQTHAPFTGYEKNWPNNLIQDVKRDFSSYLKSDNLLLLGDFFMTAGVVANTGIDRSVAHHWQEDIRSKTTNSLFKIPKALGGLCFYYAPLYFGSMTIGYFNDESLPGNVLYHWGYRSVRTVLLGGTQQAIFTHLLGSGRPCKHEGSKWQPFKHITGVSGHAFYGAVPLLTAAMMTDPPLLKYSLYAVSTLPGLSRINSNAHYLSQVILGWGLALLSSRSIYQSDSEREPAYQVGISPRSNGLMLSAQLRF